MIAALPIWFMFDRQLVWRAFSRAWAKTGNKIAARMPMIAITTSNSMSVNPRRFGVSQQSISSPFTGRMNWAVAPVLLHASRPADVGAARMPSSTRLSRADYRGMKDSLKLTWERGWAEADRLGMLAALP